MTNERTQLKAILDEIHIAGIYITKADTIHPQIKVAIHRGPFGTAEVTKTTFAFLISPSHLSRVRFDGDLLVGLNQSQIKFIDRLLQALKIKFPIDSLVKSRSEIHTLFERLDEEEDQLLSASSRWHTIQTQRSVIRKTRSIIAQLVKVQDTESCKQFFSQLIDEELVKFIHKS